jgi:hypothetical protein
MPTRIRELTLDRFERAERTLYRDAGDIYQLYCLLPTPDRRLQRAPAWVAQVNLAANFYAVEGAFYDFANQRFVFIGVDGGGLLASAYLSKDFAWSAVTALTAAAHTVGGCDQLNVAYWGGDLYVITDNSNVYRAASYVGALGLFYAGGDAWALAPFGDRMYLATTTGTIYRLNDADSAFESYYAPVGDLDVRYITAFRGYLLIVTRAPTGEFLLHRLQPDVSNPELDTVATIPPARGDQQLAGLVYTHYFALLDDDLYLSPGRELLPYSDYGLALYRFNGSQVDYLGVQPSTVSAKSYGFAAWRGHLLLYSLGASAQSFYTLVGYQFTQTLAPLSDTMPTYPALWVLGSNLFLTSTSGGTGGIRRLSATALQDSNFISPTLDMGEPGRIKRLERITVLLSGSGTDFDVIVKYMADDASTWTTAVTADGSKRISAGDLAQDFYTLRVRVDLDDDTGNNRDIQILSVSILYSIAS